MLPTELKRKISFLQMMFEELLFFSINKTQGHTMNFSDLLDVELHNDNLKMFNQAWEEVLRSLGNDLDEHFLENLYARKVKKSTLMTARDDVVSAKTLF